MLVNMEEVSMGEGHESARLKICKEMLHSLPRDNVSVITKPTSLAFQDIIFSIYRRYIFIFKEHGTGCRTILGDVCCENKNKVSR